MALGRPARPMLPTDFAYLGVDGATRTLQGIDYAHHEIHSGSHYYAYHNATVQNAGVVTISVTTPDTTKWAHLIFKLSSSDAAVFDVLEDLTSITSGGTAFTALNNDRNSTNTSGMTVTTGDTVGLDPIVPNGGTEIYAESIKSGNKIGGASRGDAEIILKQNSIYLFRLTSAANSNVCSVVLEWYEHTNKDLSA